MATQNLQDSPDILKSAAETLTNAEVQLRDFAGKAAASGDYDSLSVIANWAKALRAMLSQSGSNTPLATQEILGNGHSAAALVSRPASGGRGKSKRKKRTAPEPVYRRDSDFLVKSARSRTTRAEYEHRAASEVVFVLSDCLAERRTTKKLITADQLLEAYGKKKGPVASYQVYVALGWLVQLGLVKRHARSGYTVPSPNTIVDDVKSAWESLGAS